MKTSFDESWKRWIKTNIDRGCCKDGIFKILVDEGFSYQSITHEMGYEPSQSVEQIVNPLKHDHSHAQQKASLNNTGIAVPRNRVFIPNARRIKDARVELYELEHFLNEEECLALIDRVKSKLQPSKLSSYERDQYFRTSRTCFLEVLNDPFVADIDGRICDMLGVDASYSESIQGQYYEPGQEFKAHTDFFEEHEMMTHGATLGQRSYTFMIYLNDVEEGGETEFPNLGVAFRPRRGSAVIWNNLREDGTPNSDTLHHAHKVKSGHKAIITKWFRCRSQSLPAPPMFKKEVNELVPNFTREGVYKSKLPETLFQKIVSFYQKKLSMAADEFVEGDFITAKGKPQGKGSRLVDLSPALRQEIHDVMKPLMEAWCGKALDPTYVYGIRVYNDQAVLRPHRDRVETHIISAIINVAQEVRSDWPLVIHDNYYRRHQVILKPGEMVFYEGARLEHGRPSPLSGKSFANIFCHFKPTGYVPPLKK